MDMVNVDVVDMATAVALTLALTEFGKRVLQRLTGDGAKFAPLIAVVAAALSVGALIEVGEATQQDYVLAVIAVTLAAVGGHSGVKNVASGVQAKARRP